MASTAEASPEPIPIPPIFRNFTVDQPRKGLWGLSFADIFHIKNHIRQQPAGADPGDILEDVDQFRNFLKADPIIDGPRWSPSRVLGEGGYGIVGLWQLKDENGEVQDEMVVKEWNYDDRLEVPGRRGLAKEAVIQYQMNRRRGARALAPILRHLKFVQDPNDRNNHKWRTYSEFCPNGDLARLATRYRAWGKYLPETFLWHVFHSLARVAREMARRPWVDYEDMEVFPNGWFLLHFDLKPPNVLIGKRRARPQETGGSSTADGDSPSAKRSRPNEEGDGAQVAATDNFPAIKVHDFGLADFTASNDADNPDEFFWSGTPGYKPPVSWTQIAMLGLC